MVSAGWRARGVQRVDGSGVVCGSVVRVCALHSSGVREARSGCVAEERRVWTCQELRDGADGITCVRRMTSASEGQVGTTSGWMGRKRCGAASRSASLFYGLVSTLMCVYMIQAFAFTPVRSVMLNPSPLPHIHTTALPSRCATSW